MSNQQFISAGSKSLVAFLCLQGVILISGGGWAWSRYHTMQTERQSPVPRIDPLRVDPQYDNPKVISDEQLVRVLRRLQPRLRGRQPKMNYVDHALRFWGTDAVFEDSECLSGEEMRALLLDHRMFAEAWGTKEKPFLIPTDKGVKIRTVEGNASASHVDHTLASLAEAGTPLDYPVITPTGEMQLRDVFNATFENFKLNQVEYEWSALAFALYLPPTSAWYNGEGQRISFDMLAERIMRQRIEQGVCSGNHRLHALVMLLRVDEQMTILSPDGRAKIISYLQDVTRRLVEHQSPEGYWDSGWPGVEDDGLAPPKSRSLDTLSSRLLITGHVLEWWSLAPKEILPPDAVVERAGQWMANTIEELSPAQIRSTYTFLTHAGRALALWRGRYPADVIRSADAEIVKVNGEPNETATPKAVDAVPQSENKNVAEDIPAGAEK